MTKEEIEGLLDRLAYIFTSQEEERKIKAKLLAYVEELERRMPDEECKRADDYIEQQAQRIARLEKALRDSDDILRPLMPLLSLNKMNGVEIGLEISKVRMKIQQALAKHEKENHDK